MEELIKGQIELMKSKVNIINEMIAAKADKDYPYLEGNKAALKDCIEEFEHLLEIDQSKPLPQDEKWNS